MGKGKGRQARSRRNRAQYEPIPGFTAANQNQYPVMKPGRKVLGGFPPMMRARLKYVETFALDPAAGSIASTQWNLRSLYDPNDTGTGHQPSNYDRLMQIYNRYTVFDVKVSMANASNSTSSVTPGLWGFLVTAAGSQVSGFSNIDTLLEQPYVKYSRVSAGQGNLNAFPGALTAKIPCSPWLGTNNKELFLDSYSSSDGASPSKTIYLETFFGNINGNDPGSVPFRIEIEFNAAFFSPKITLPSFAVEEEKPEEKDPDLVLVPAPRPG